MVNGNNKKKSIFIVLDMLLVGFWGVNFWFAYLPSAVIFISQTPKLNGHFHRQLATLANGIRTRKKAGQVSDDVSVANPRVRRRCEYIRITVSSTIKVRRLDTRPWTLALLNHTDTPRFLFVITNVANSRMPEFFFS